MVTTVVALAALCFTSHNWHLNWREKRKKVRVTLGRFFIATASGQRLGGGSLSLRISNRGAKCVLTGYHVQTMWSTKKYRRQYETKPSMRLTPGVSVRAGW